MNIAADPAAPVHRGAVSHARAARTSDADMLIRRKPAHDPLAAKGSGQCACGGGCPGCAADSGLGSPPRIQPKLAVGAVDDWHEHKADATADQVVGATGLSGKPIGTATSLDGATAPPVVHEALSEPGRPLDGPTRAFLEDGFGSDFSHVRVHTGAKAAQSAAAVDALAYTVGSDIVFGAAEYAPMTVRGLQLLAHEASHVVQQGSGLRRRRLQRFAASEVSKIAPTHADMLTQIRKLVDDATRNGTFDWDFFVEIAGGTSSTRQLNKVLGSNDPTIKSRLLIRYLFTCRCGLIDMRHFLQMLYISQFATGMSQSNSYGNRVATGKGREHELTATDSESRFAPEDTPSNALGAATNLSMPGIPSPDSVFSHIKETLSRCDPIDWSSLSVASRQQVVDFYSALVADPKPRKVGDMIPEHQNETAVPDILSVTECSARERSFPFEVDPDNRKTIEGKNFLGGSKSLDDDDDIRAFLFTQRREVIRALPKSEKIRFEEILRSWWISDDDLEALKILYNESTLDELRAY